MRYACWMLKATDTHSEYIILVFPEQHWLRECAPVLPYTHITCFLLSSVWHILNITAYKAVRSLVVFCISANLRLSPSSKKAYWWYIKACIKKNLVLRPCIRWKHNRSISNSYQYDRTCPKITSVMILRRRSHWQRGIHVNRETSLDIQKLCSFFAIIKELCIILSSVFSV